MDLTSLLHLLPRELIKSDKTSKEIILIHESNQEENWAINLTTRIERKMRDRDRMDLFVDLDADGALGDVPDTAGAAVVELVGHPLVDGAVHLDVDVVADLVRPEVRRQRDAPLLPKGPREEIPRPRSEPMTGRHLSSLPTPLLRLGFEARRNGRPRQGYGY